MSSFSCPPPWLSDHWDILLRWMKNHFGRSCGDIQMAAWRGKVLPGASWLKGWRKEWTGGGGTGQLEGSWWSCSPCPRHHAQGSWHTCQSSAARARMSPGGHTRSFWRRELVEILRQGASGLGLRTALLPGLSLRNHYFQTSFSSNI